MATACVSLTPQLHPTDVEALEQLEDRDEREQAYMDNAIVPPDLQAPHGYGIYSARFGNIYTARQLLQLIQRAYGEFVPVED